MRIRQLYLWHRYLGIALCLLFAMWFVSGVVMMYVRMPILFPQERLAHLPPLDPARVAIPPAEAAARAGLTEPPRRMRLASLIDRPIYYLLPRGERWRGVYADDGAFRYQDHGVPWSVNAPNLTFNLVRARNLAAYVGTAKFSGGTVAIQRFLPMSAEMTTRFALDGPRVQLNHIDLVTDGAMTHVNGHVDFSKPGPEMTYNVHSTLDFNRMRELFFADASWDVSGAGTFDGVFKLFKNGRDLTGQFRSDEARLRVSGVEYTFPHMHGALSWLPAPMTCKTS